jgi:lysophospholipase L1-like esterase
MHRWPRFLPPSWIALALVAALGGCQALSNDTNKAAEKPKPKAEAPPDWPNLARYRDENARLAAAPDGAIRVVFMGDSITDFWPKVGRFFPGKDYIDRGISGQTTPQMLVRFRPDVIDLKPRVVVILAGTNDVAGNTGPATPEMIEGNIASMAELARANGIRVVLSSILPVYDYPWKPGLQPAPEIVALNAWIRDYADKSGFVYLDYFSAMADGRQGMRPEYSADGVHPNAAGYAVMEPLAETAIAEALAEK